MMLQKWFLLLLMVVSVLTACQSKVYNQTEANIATVKIKQMDAVRHQDATLGRNPSLLVKQGLYVDTSPISLDRSPPWLNNRIIIRGDQLPFSYYSRTIASGAGNNILTKYQAELDQAAKVSINYSGTVKGALDLIATKTGYVYNVRRNMIYWQEFVTKTYDIAFMPGGTEYMMGKSSGSSTAAPSVAGASSVSDYSNTDTTMSEYSSLKGNLSIWKDLETTIKQLLSPEGKVIVSESSTSVTVRDKATNVDLIGQYVRNLNANLSKQVLVKISIIEVNLDSAYNMGIDWSIVRRVFSGTNFQLDANYGTPVSIKALTGEDTPPIIGLQAVNPGKTPSQTILLNALSQQGKTATISEPRVLCLNNQVSVIRITRSEGYAASVQNTTLAGTAAGSSTVGSVTAQITPGIIVTGLTLYLLPKIFNGDVYLQVNADLSTNLGLGEFGPAPTSGQPTSQIQLPNITAKHFNQRSMIHSGNTLILSGFRQTSNQTGAMQLLQSQTLGGKASLELSKETIILITPIILNGSA